MTIYVRYKFSLEIVIECKRVMVYKESWVQSLRKEKAQVPSLYAWITLFPLD